MTAIKWDRDDEGLSITLHGWGYAYVEPSDAGFRTGLRQGGVDMVSEDVHPDTVHDEELAKSIALYKARCAVERDVARLGGHVTWPKDKP